MPKKRAAKNCKIQDHLSARPDCKEGRFIQVGNSLLLSKVFQGLTANARLLYLCLADEAAGKRQFRFSHGTAKKYGFAPTSFDRAIKELEKSHFIERIDDEEHAQFRTAEFRFVYGWKLIPSPHDGEGKTGSIPHDGEGQ